ncbi:MAG: guanitoxin biosynthesis heme-dependent pre-guanitoxin N-hydroxylase GntA [Rhodospirillales bacterium]
MKKTDTARHHFGAFLQSKTYPCVGAKSALACNNMSFLGVGSMESAADDLEIHQTVKNFGRSLVNQKGVVQSLVVFFSDPLDQSERDFEQTLWMRLQCLHNLDVASGSAWDNTVATDPELAHFSMSVGGEAYFVLGMHPHASRPARRFEVPVMVFNPHGQFEKLREDGLFEKMKTTIRKRDEDLTGGLNPMLDDFGQSSEACQYSGREVNKEWKCPFEFKGDE